MVGRAVSKFVRQASRKRAPSVRIMQCLLLCAGALSLSGCVFLDVKEQQKKADEFCAVEGHASVDRREEKPIVVVLVRKIGADIDRRESWEIADHFVLDRPGRWAFRVSAGTYGLGAFQDINADLKLQRGESTCGWTHASYSNVSQAQRAKTLRSKFQQQALRG